MDLWLLIISLRLVSITMRKLSYLATATADTQRTMLQSTTTVSLWKAWIKTRQLRT